MRSKGASRCKHAPRRVGGWFPLSKSYALPTTHLPIDRRLHEHNLELVDILLRSLGELDGLSDVTLLPVVTYFSNHYNTTLFGHCPRLFLQSPTADLVVFTQHPRSLGKMLFGAVRSGAGHSGSAQPWGIPRA